MGAAQPQYQISFPQRSEKLSDGHIDQHEEIVEVTFLDVKPTRTQHFRVQDYTDVFAHPGLYEKIVHDELECQSPEVLVILLAECLKDAKIRNGDPEYRILDLAAGNGIVGEELKRQLQYQVKYLIGSDILPAAKLAASRDRPGIYDDYIVADLSRIFTSKVQQRVGNGESFDIITMCAALGFEPALLALLKAVQGLRQAGLVAICVNKASLGNTSEGVWGVFMRELGEGKDGWKGMRECGRRKYLHRVDVRGREIMYVAVVFRKEG